MNLLIKNLLQIIKKILLFCLSFMLCFCSISDKHNHLTIKISHDIKTKDFNLSDLCSEVEYTSLDNSFPIVGITEIHFCDNKIILQTKNQGILVYGLDGHFINKIGCFGEGPGEYIKGRTSFTVNNTSSEIFILTNYHDVLKYDIMGNHLGSFLLNVGIEAKNIYSFSKDKLLFVQGNTLGNAKFNWIITNEEGNPYFAKMNYMNYRESEIAGPSPECILFENDGRLYYFEQYNDTIFQIGENSYDIHMFFANNNRLTPELAGRDGKFGVGDKYLLPRNIIETNNYVYIEYIFQKKKFLAQIDKSTNDVYNVSTDKTRFGFVNDYDSGVSFYSICREDKYLIGVIEPYELKQHVASEAFKTSTPKYPEKKRKLEQLANNLNINENPVLMIVKLKE